MSIEGIAASVLIEVTFGKFSVDLLAQPATAPLHLFDQGLLARCLGLVCDAPRVGGHHLSHFLLCAGKWAALFVARAQPAMHDRRLLELKQELVDLLDTILALGGNFALPRCADGFEAIQLALSH